MAARKVIAQGKTAAQLCISEMLKPRPRNGQVLIRVRATAVNRADILQRQGKYPPPPGESDIMGLEVAGEVEQVGENVNRWKIGDKVMALLTGGGYATHCVAEEHCVLPIPKQCSLEEGAAIPEAWITAFQLIHFVGQTKAGENVLIHAAGSGVGTAAIQLVRGMGAVPIATVRTDSKVNQCKDLGAEHCIVVSGGCFADQVNIYAHMGANVILDCIGASYWRENNKCLAMDGRIVLYGLMGGHKLDGESLAGLVAKRGSLVTSTLRSRSLEYKQKLCGAFEEKIINNFACYRPIISKIFRGLESMQEAHTFVEENQNVGKVIITV